MNEKMTTGGRRSCSRMMRPAMAHFRAKMGAALIVGFSVLFGFAVGPAIGDEGIDPDADKILRSMSECLDGLSAFSVNADTDNELIDLAGQKLQISNSETLVLKRPGNFYLNRQGVLVDVELFFDGKILTIHGKNLHSYFQIDSPGTIDNAIDTLRNEIGLDASGADLFYTNSYAGLSEGVMSSAYRGTMYVSGVECHYLTFREDQFDWQLWVRAEGAPLPMKYIITTKWMTGAPQYTVRFRDWNTKPQIDAGQFDFRAPKGTKQIEPLRADQMGNLVIEGVE